VKVSALHQVQRYAPPRGWRRIRPKADLHRAVQFGKVWPEAEFRVSASEIVKADTRTRNLLFVTETAYLRLGRTNS
jgi:hypothetical protein